MAFWAARMGPRAARAAAGATLLAVAMLVLAHLGRYALWDDEAQTALFAEAVWRTGDTSAVHGHNVVLYRDAVEISSSLHNRLVAPLSYVLPAPFVRESLDPWWARVPFALAGIATVALLLRWLVALDLTRRTWALAALAITGNVSFLLYARQARYYTLAMLLCTVVTYAYAHRGRARWAVVAICIGGPALWATHYLAFAGFAAALAVDYLCWGRREAPFARRDVLAIVLAHVVVCVPIVLVWYPLGKGMAGKHGFEAVERLLMWLRTLRDMNNCEYGVGLLVLAAPLLYRRSRDPLLLRLPLAIVVATVVVTLFSPQPPTAAVADVRYVAFLIPACVALGVRVIDALPVPGGLAVALGAVAFQTTILHVAIERLHPTKHYRLPIRCTLASYLGELAAPPVSAYGLTAAWLEAHAKPGDSAVVYPDYAAYPLMFHAPHVVYGWQLSEARAKQLPPLPAIQLVERVAPDWIIDFDHHELDAKLRATLTALGAHYDVAASLPATGVDKTRAELFWHRFDAASAYDPKAPITIWRRAP
jgi:hypothetical protein